MMKKNIFITLLICLLLTAISFGQDLQTNDSQGQADNKLDARRVERIESYFAGRIAELRYRVEREIRQLEIAENYQPSSINPSVCAHFIEAVLLTNDISGDSTEQIARGLGKAADKKSDLIAKMEFEAGRLERQMRAAIRNAEQGPKSPQITEHPKGTITGIIYSADKPSVLIDRQLLHQGDTIDGAMIVKIYPDRIALGKGDKMWTQTIGQNPPVQQ